MTGSSPVGSTIFADVAQSVERLLWKGQAGGSSPSIGLLDDMRLLLFLPPNENCVISNW